MHFNSSPTLNTHNELRSLIRSQVELKRHHKVHAMHTGYPEAYKELFSPRASTGMLKFKTVCNKLALSGSNRFTLLYHKSSN